MSGNNSSPPVSSAKQKRTPKASRQREPFVGPYERLQSCREANLGFSLEQARLEALRCLHCADPKCIQACPLHIDIRSFIDRLVDSDFAGALKIIQERSPFPAICGRICQHERFCENACLLGKKLAPVAIGALERSAADFGRPARELSERASDPLGRRLALVGSGPASLIAAHELAAKGYRVTVFEALHEPGGVLIYGIPPFRLPREIVRAATERLRRMGISFCTDFMVGKTCTIDELFTRGYEAVFLGTGAGLPNLMGVPGEYLIGVYTANEFLTRLNLMEAHRFPESDTPIRVGPKTIVVGGGNSAIDAARWARRLGSQTTVLFRRGREQMRARREEITHAEEEGVEFKFLAAPMRLEGDPNGIVRRMQCVCMRLEATDEPRPAVPVPIPGSEFWVEVDTVVGAVGQRPNLTVQCATPSLITRDHRIAINTECATSLRSVYAGGDVTNGGSTVVEAMRDGRAAAEAIDRALQGTPAIVMQQPETRAEERFRIVANQQLAPGVFRIEVEAPEVATHWQAGQFVVLRPTAESERIPLTLVDGDAVRGTVTLVFKAAGKTTRMLAALQIGAALADLLGPLGKPATVEHLGAVWCVGGGVGIAELLPVARALRRAGNQVVAFVGVQSANLQVLKQDLLEAADEVHWATDDGSAGFHGTVVDLVRDTYNRCSRAPTFVHVIGPVSLMQAIAELTRERGVRTVASLNPIMIDGTGMCGGCRASVGGKPVFVCVDGPEFDAHQVDFEQLALRNRAYLPQEKLAYECRIMRQTSSCSIK